MTEFIDKTEAGRKTKKTEFVLMMGPGGTTRVARCRSDEYETVELVRRKEDEFGFDFMVATDVRGNEVWYLGLYNEGC